MPFAPNKIRINGTWCKATAKAIKQAFKALRHTGDYIELKGWAAETEKFRDELRVECQKHYLADMEFIAYLHDLHDRMQMWADSRSKP
jgi:hypothetical protein